MKKMLLLGCFISLASLNGIPGEIAQEVSTLENKIETRKKLAFYGTILSYSAIVTGITAICILQDKTTAFLCSLISYSGISALLSMWESLQIHQCRYLFKELTTKRINDSGQIVDGKHAYLSRSSSHLMNDDQFVILGIKSGFSERELIDLAKTSGRIELAYKLKFIIS